MDIQEKYLEIFLQNIFQGARKRDKSILTSGLLKNFTISDLEIIKNEYINANQTLLKNLLIKIGLKKLY